MHDGEETKRRKRDQRIWCGFSCRNRSLLLPIAILSFLLPKLMHVIHQASNPGKFDRARIIVALTNDHLDCEDRARKLSLQE